MAAIFWQVKYLLKLETASLHRYPVGKIFSEIALSGTVFEIQAFLCFAIFAEKFGNPQWPPSRDSPQVKNFVEIALCSTVFEIQGFLCFAFLKKI